MKKIFFFKLLLCSSLIFSQEYKFNMQCEMLETQIKNDIYIYPKIPPRNIIFFYNSNNPNYIAYNFRQNEIHLFDHQLKSLKLLETTKINNQEVFKLVRESNFDKFRDEIKIKKITVNNIGNNLYLIKSFPKNEEIKPNLEIKLQLKSSDSELIRIHFMDLTENIHRQIYDKLLSFLPNSNYQIENIYLDYHNGVIDEMKISKCKKINLKFKLDFKQ